METPLVPQVPAGDFSNAGGFFSDCNDEDLVYFLLNVGDGDAQLILLPAERDSATGGPLPRRALIVDIAVTGKLLDLVDALTTPPSTLFSVNPGAFAVAVGTHPHDDHITGMPEFIARFGAETSEYWEPGYYHPTAAYLETMHALEERPNIQHTQPTAGMTRYVSNVKVQVLSPAIGLRNRFDSYGVEPNNASISLKIEFPASRVEQRGADRRYLRIRHVQALLLGADAQTLSWGQVMVDFPELRPDDSPVAKELRLALGSNPLRAQVFKVPHHASKHGVNLELVEAIQPKLSLVSSVAGAGKYNFPHRVTLEAIREGLQATTMGRTKRKKDHELGLHYTAGMDDTGHPLGSIALVMSPTGSKRHLWRFGDRPGESVDLAQGRLFTKP
jgi:hypothetical protein